MARTKGEWRIRFMNAQNEDDGECDFFIEATEPKNQIGKIEIMMEDFGEHSGYPRDQKLADAKSISMAPKMLETLKEILDLATLTGVIRSDIGNKARNIIKEIEDDK